MGKNKNRKMIEQRLSGRPSQLGMSQMVSNNSALLQAQVPNQDPSKKIKILAWAATPFVITGFGCVVKEILSNLFRSYPGVYDVALCAINYHGDFNDEFAITGGPQNGRLMQWSAAVHGQGGINLYGQPKFIELIRNLNMDIDLVWLFEDPFWVGGAVPGTNPPVGYIDQIRAALSERGLGHVPIVSYFPIDGVPKQAWIKNISKSDIPITYLNFGAHECIKACPELNGRIHVIPHGVNTKEFFPMPKEDALLFKRAFFGERLAEKFMVLNVNRNQLRKLVPSNLLAFKEFQRQVPESFMFLNMRPVDVGWNLIECCKSLQLEVGKDVVFPPDFSVQKGLTIDQLNAVFNCADVLTSTATGGGWELAVTQAFATKTSVVMPANTSHVELCGKQGSPEEQRGVLYRSGSTLAQIMIFPQDNEVPRPIPDLDDMVAKMKWVHDNPEASEKITENAYKWVTENIQWGSHIVPKFHKIFSAAKNLKIQRLQQVKK